MYFDVKSHHILNVTWIRLQSIRENVFEKNLVRNWINVTFSNTLKVARNDVFREMDQSVDLKISKWIKASTNKILEFENHKKSYKR